MMLCPRKVAFYAPIAEIYPAPKAPNFFSDVYLMTTDPRLVVTLLVF